MDGFVAFMSAQAFEAFGKPVSWGELIGFVTGAACVWGVARQKLWNWPVGIVNNVAFFLLFLQFGLFADATLQVIFAILSLYGWYRWVRGRSGTQQADDLPISNASTRALVLMALAIAVLTGVVAWALHTFFDSKIAIPDAFILAGSLAATLWQAQKKMQHWWIWIIVDLVSVPLYINRGLLLTAVLYVVFLALCVYGLIDWRRTARQQAEALGSHGSTAARSADARLETV